ncbi:hypothetical protein Q5P01_003269 [Channa striata]|uniref:Uncharacterized protein n=1 Tax=Channa striata TaxID=64152 RepID=A0AA88NFM0_CHASR|nr:hypothetical protein Q5P01_003269 [Channa striata]
MHAGEEGTCSGLWHQQTLQSQTNRTEHLRKKSFSLRTTDKERKSKAFTFLSFKGAYHSCYRVRSGVQPGQVSSLSQGQHRETYTDRQPLTLIFTPTGSLEAPVNLTCMCLDCGRKLEYLEETHTSLGRTSKLHT